ncbi:MAG: PQQ-binding-like beta-propeller repeat protein [Bacteroidales bacterium]
MMKPNRMGLMALVMWMILMPLTAANLKFAHLTDLHVVPGNDNERFLAAAVADINAGDYDFVIVTGDLNNEGSDSELQTVYDLLGNLRVPYHVVSGNHETNWSESGCSTFFKLWKQDRFAFEKEGFLFVGFACGPYMKMGDGFMKYEDIQWLKRTLKEQLKPGMKVLSFAHYPLDESVSNWSQVTSVLKESPVAAAFCGHGHTLKLMNFDSIPGFMGRALTMKNSPSPGYNAVEVAGDSLFYSEKIVGEAPVRKIAISMNDRTCLTGIKKSPDQMPVGDFQNMKQMLQDNASVYNGISVNKGIVYLANSLGEVKAIDTKKNRELWSVNLGLAVYAKPLYHQGKVIVGTTDGRLLAFDAKNGKELWTLPASRIVVGEGAMEGNDLYIAASREFMRINIKTGRVVWSKPIIASYSQGRPVIQGDKVIFGAWDTYLNCLNKQTGEIIWRWSNGKKVNMLSPGNVVPAVVEDKVIIVAPDRYMTALDLATGKELWRTNKYKVRESLGLSEDGKRVYAKLMDGELLAVSTEGSVYRDLWCTDMGIGYEHNPCPNVEKNGIVYSGSRQGVVVAFDSATRRVLWKEKAGHSSVNAFTKDENGDVWCSLIEGAVFKLNQK